MGLYAASARPCPRHHQSSSAPGLLSLPRQAANHSLPGSSIGDGRREAERRKIENHSVSVATSLESDLIDIPSYLLGA